MKDIYMNPNWTLPEADYGNMNKKVQAEWEAIKQEQPELQIEKLHNNIARIYNVSFHDSGIRQALFYRMAAHYKVEYDVLYNTWLNAGADVLTTKVQKQLNPVTNK